MSYNPAEVKFFADQDIAADLPRALRLLHYPVYTASETGLYKATDDQLTVWADDHGAILISADRTFARRRLKQSIGVHVWMKCPDWETADILLRHLTEVLDHARRGNVVITVSRDSVRSSSSWT